MDDDVMLRVISYGLLTLRSRVAILCGTGDNRGGAGALA